MLNQTGRRNSEHRELLQTENDGHHGHPCQDVLPFRHLQRRPGKCCLGRRHGTHARMSSHSATSKEGLENAVWVDVMEPMPFSSFKVLTAVIHPPLFLITKYGICFSHLFELMLMIFLF